MSHQNVVVLRIRIEPSFVNNRQIASVSDSRWARSSYLLVIHHPFHIGSL